MVFKGLLFFLTLFTRFYGLDWGGGYYFHPDENNMAWAVERLTLPRLNPEFFAYGQFPLYLTYFALRLVNIASSFNPALLGLRFWSAVFSGLSVWIGWLLVKKLFKKDFWANLFSLFLIFSPGLIQTAHFGTTESILVFVGLSTVFLSLKFLEKFETRYLLLLGLVTAIGLASKISALLFVLPVLIAVLKSKNKIRNLFLFGFLVLILTLLFSPYLVLEFKESFRVLNYESDIARGIVKPFYTIQFLKTLPIIFQLTKIFPWVLGLPMFVVLIIAVLFFFTKIKKVFKLPVTCYLLLVTFLPWFLFNAFLFTKWTRFMVPVLPFLILFIMFFLKKILKKIDLFWQVLIIFILILPGIIFMKIYLYQDIRVFASHWINNNLAENSVILSEAGNIINMPFQNKKNFKITNFDFYNLEHDKNLQSQIYENLAKSDYFLSPSRRMFANFLRLPKEYFYTYNFYKKLLSKNSNLKLIKKFNIFNNWQLFLLGTDLNSEETWTVFDHPTIRLYKQVLK